MSEYKPFKRHNLSEFTADEQRTAIALYDEVTSHDARKAELEEIVASAKACLAARAHFQSLCQRPALADFAEQLATEQAALFAEQQAALKAAQNELNGKLAEEWKSLHPRFSAQFEAYNAILSFRGMSRGLRPVVYDDIPWAQELLAAGLDRFEQIVARELAETRSVMQKHKRPMFNNWEFQEPAGYIEGKYRRPGETIFLVADRLRHARMVLAKLREEAVKPRK